MRNSVLLGVAMALLAGLAGCTDVKEVLGYTKQSPDEFQVYARAPLSLPPDYALRPPAPGSPRPQEGTARDQAASAVFGDYTFGTSVAPELISDDPLTAATAGESALLQSAGATGIDPGIRQTINQETTALEEQNSTFVDTLIFWQKPTDTSTIIDPQAEQQRIEENQALGRPVTEGETPTIERKKRGLLEGMF